MCGLHLQVCLNNCPQKGAHGCFLKVLTSTVSKSIEPLSARSPELSLWPRMPCAAGLAQVVRPCVLGKERVRWPWLAQPGDVRG